jgi:hypothetical protein
VQTSLLVLLLLEDKVMLSNSLPFLQIHRREIDISKLQRMPIPKLWTILLYSYEDK